MNGHMFQLLTEQPRRNQFQRKLEELEIFCAKKYTKEIDLFNSIFDTLKTPEIPKPNALPDDADDVDKAGFAKDIKLWKRDERILKSTMKSL